MLVITIKGIELWDEVAEKFSTFGDSVLELEHSLVSLSKWESKWEKPFLAPGEKSAEEILDYINAMITTPVFPPEVLTNLSQENISQITEYIESKQSATLLVICLKKKGGANETITSELIYYWMVIFNIPFETESWHLNRLFSLIRICNVKNSKPKPMSKSAIAARNRELNAQRKAQLGTTG